MQTLTTCPVTLKDKLVHVWDTGEYHLSGRCLDIMMLLTPMQKLLIILHVLLHAQCAQCTHTPTRQPRGGEVFWHRVLAHSLLDVLV